jgi:hypothetical protein
MVSSEVFLSEMVWCDVVHLRREHRQQREFVNDPFGCLRRAEQVDQYHMAFGDLERADYLGEFTLDFIWKANYTPDDP